MLLMGELCSKPFILVYSTVCRFLYFEINQLGQNSIHIVFEDIVQHSSTAGISELCYSG